MDYFVVIFIMLLHAFCSYFALVFFTFINTGPEKVLMVWNNIRVSK